MRIYLISVCSPSQAECMACRHVTCTVCWPIVNDLMIFWTGLCPSYNDCVMQHSKQWWIAVWMEYVWIIFVGIFRYLGGSFCTWAFALSCSIRKLWLKCPKMVLLRCTGGHKHKQCRVHHPKCTHNVGCLFTTLEYALVVSVPDHVPSCFNIIAVFTRESSYCF